LDSLGSMEPCCMSNLPYGALCAEHCATLGGAPAKQRRRQTRHAAEDIEGPRCWPTAADHPQLMVSKRCCQGPAGLIPGRVRRHLQARGNTCPAWWVVVVCSACGNLAAAVRQVAGPWGTQAMAEGTTSESNIHGVREQLRLCHSPAGRTLHQAAPSAACRSASAGALVATTAQVGAPRRRH
jgi:hypothetical protein